MKEELDKRKRKILQAIVEEYIDTAEPVSSGNLVKDLECSSATIRNEMAELEKIGYIEKPHTSAGRIPSQKGYRYYVDELVRDDNLSKKEMEIIRERLETKVNVLMAVILTDSGIIRESIIKFDEDINEQQVSDLTYLFKNKLVGRPLETINSPIEDFIMAEVNAGINVIKKIIEEINKIILASKQIYLDGANKVMNMPEFKKVDVAKEFLNVLDAKDLVADVLNTGIADNINIYIGKETEKEELKNFSIVTFNHLLEDRDIGTIGIIGPTRMDYSKIISVMKYISKKLNDDFKKGKY